MITQQEKEQASRKKIEHAINICNEAIAKSEKYERLKDNKDWQGFLDDLKILSVLHDKEIQSAHVFLADAPSNGYVKMDEFGKQSYVSSKSDWTDFIVRHYTQKTEIDKWILEPERILKMSAMAREKLPELQEQLKEYDHVASSSGNGKS